MYIPLKYYVFGLAFLVTLSQVSSVSIYRDEDGEDEEEEKKNQAGVLDIVSGALSGNFDKIINGAFSFTDDGVREGVVPIITGKKPATRPTTEGSTDDGDEDEGEATL